MSSIERVQKAAKLEEPDWVPVAPYIVFFIARVCGVKNNVFLLNPLKAEECSKAVFERYGGFDIYIPGTMCNWVLTHQPLGALYFDWKLPGFDLSEDALPQITERSIIDQEVYRVIAEKGIEHFRLRTENDIKIRYGVDINQLLDTTKKLFAGIKQWVRSRQVMLLSGEGIWHPVDVLSYLCGVGKWLADCVYRPDEIFIAAERIFKDYLSVYREYLKDRAPIEPTDLAMAGSHRTSASFLSPRQFEKIGFPFLKMIIDELTKDFEFIVLHLDGDWAPLLEYFREFPKGRCILQLDHLTDIVKAKEIIGDHCCLMGNVDPTLLSIGSPVKVEEHCKYLIERCKEGGGFILSSSCEVPPETPPENIMAMKNAVMRYGLYK